MAGEKGCSWDTFEKEAIENESLSGMVSSRHPISPTTGRLCKEDMAIYGEVPVTDHLSLVLCKACERVVKTEAVAKHNEHYHSSALPYLPNSHDAGPSSATPTGGFNLQGQNGAISFFASPLPTTTPAPSENSGGKHNKEYDPDKHCGVWIAGEGRCCTHSLLNCKLHHLADRRMVKGRSASFEELAERHKQQRKSKKLEKLWADAGLQHMSTTRHGGRDSPSSPAHSSPPVNGPIPSRRDSAGASSGCGLSARRHSAASPRPSNRRALDLEQSSPLLEKREAERDPLCDFPKPLATCPLTCAWRRTPAGRMVFDRRSDSLRTLLSRLVASSSSKYKVIQPPSNHNFKELLESQKNRKRKYFSHRTQLSHLHSSGNHLSSSSNNDSSNEEPVEVRSSKLPVPLPLNPAPPTTPPQLTPLTPLHPGATPTSQPTSRSASLSQHQPAPSVHFFPPSQPLPPPPNLAPLTTSSPSTDSAIIGSDVFWPSSPVGLRTSFDNAPSRSTTSTATSTSTSATSVSVANSSSISSRQMLQQPPVATIPTHAGLPAVGPDGSLSQPAADLVGSHPAVGGNSVPVPLQNNFFQQPPPYKDSQQQLHELAMAKDLQQQGVSSRGDQRFGLQEQLPLASQPSTVQQQQQQQIYRQSSQLVGQDQQELLSEQHQVNQQQRIGQQQQVSVQQHIGNQQQGQPQPFGLQQLGQQQQQLHQPQQQQQQQQVSSQQQLGQQVLQRIQLQQQLEQQRRQQQQVHSQPVPTSQAASSSYSTSTSSVIHNPEQPANNSRLPPMPDWSAGNLPGNRNISRDMLGVNGEVGGAHQNELRMNAVENLHVDKVADGPHPPLREGVGLVRENSYPHADVTDRTMPEAGSKRKKTGGSKKSAPKRPRLDSQHHRPASSAEEGVASAGGATTPVQANYDREAISTIGSHLPLPGTMQSQVPNMVAPADHRGVAHGTSNLHPSHDQETRRSSSNPQHGNNGLLPLSSHSNNSVPERGSLSYYRNSQNPTEAARQLPGSSAPHGAMATPTSQSLHESIRNRLGVVSHGRPTTPPQGSVVTPPQGSLAPVSTSAVSQLTSSSQVAGKERLAPEFGVIRVKTEPGLEEEEDNSPAPPIRSLPNGLVTSQQSAPHQVTPTSSAGVGSLRGVASGGGVAAGDSGSSVISPSFNSLHSPGQTLLINSPSHGLSSLAAQHNLLQLYSNPQRLLAAAAAQPPAVQQLANLRQLEMYKLLQMQQQQQHARLLQQQQPVAQAAAVASSATPTIQTAIGLQQGGVSSGAPAIMPRLQMPAIAAQRPSSQHQRLGMPSLTPRVHAPISHVSNTITNFSRSEGLRSLPTLTPANLNRTQNSLSSPMGPYHQDPSPTASNRPHLPSQQVT